MLLLSFIIEEDSVGTNLLLVLYCVKCNYPLHLNPHFQQSHHQVCGMCLLLSPVPWGGPIVLWFVQRLCDHSIVSAANPLPWGPFTNPGVTALCVCVCSSRDVLCLCVCLLCKGGSVVMSACERRFCVSKIKGK